VTNPQVTYLIPVHRGLA